MLISIRDKEEHVGRSDSYGKSIDIDWKRIVENVHMNFVIASKHVLI